MTTHDRADVDPEQDNVVSIAQLRDAEIRYQNLIVTGTSMISCFRRDLRWLAEGLMVHGARRWEFLTHPCGVPFEYDRQDLDEAARKDPALRAMVRARSDLGRQLKVFHRFEGNLP